MSLFADVWKWFADPANWSGTAGIPNRVLEHVEVSGAAVVAAAVIALPVGLYIGHRRRFEFLAVSIANVGRAVPSFGVIALVFPLFLVWFGSAAFGFLPTFVAMTVLAIPPILTNTYVGIQAVDADAVEAARGMGMREGQVIARLEVPLATPLIVAGFRTATVQVIATATLAALIGGGGLGRYIIDGFAQQRPDMTTAGAVLVALLAIVAEVTFAVLERVISPRTGKVAGGRRVYDS